MPYVTSIGVATPPHKHQQSAIAGFMVKAMQLTDADARKLHVIFQASGIATRHSVLADYGRTSGFSFYENLNYTGSYPGTARRMEAYKEYASILSTEAATRCLNSCNLSSSQITHLIVVSCTGLYAPGLDIDLVNALGLPTNVERLSIQFMGCYAAFNALRVANDICKARKESRVLIVCTELCSLHFQNIPSEDNLLANALFADGSAAVLVEGVPGQRTSLELEQFHSELATQGAGDMAWGVGDQGFEMRLSSYVPDIIGSGIQHLTNRLIEKAGLTWSDIRYFAVHPGGKRILETIARELQLTRNQLEHSYDVLRNCGNMSSATVLFVLKNLMDQLEHAPEAGRILSFAFGPGLTMESMILGVKLAAKRNDEPSVHESATYA